jgi:uroporphyrinogen-III synthase
MRLLIIRPQPGADATARLARLAGIEPVTSPLFEIQPLAWLAKDPAHYDALMLTSTNAVRHAGAALAALLPLPVYAVGEATANAARAAGFHVIFAGGTDANALLVQAAANGDARLLWLTGGHQSRINLPPGVTLDSALVYNSAALAPAQAFIELLSSPILVALHSVRAARHFLTICEAHGIDKNTISIAALSPSIAESAAEGWQDVLISDAPNDAALMAKMKSHFTSVHRGP